MFSCIFKNKVLARVHTHVFEKMKSEFVHLGQDTANMTDSSNHITESKAKDLEKLLVAQAKMRQEGALEEGSERDGGAG